MRHSHRKARTTVVPAAAVLLLFAGLGLWSCGAVRDVERGDVLSEEQTLTTEIWAESTTSVSQGQTTASTSLPVTTSTVTILRQQELRWGETAAVDGGAVTVDAPMIDPAVEASQPGFMVVFCMVAITNTGETPISFAPYDFNLEGGRSGSGGMGSKPASGALEMGTLSPGQTVTGAVRFNLHEDDAPVLVWLVVPWSKQIRVNWR